MPVSISFVSSVDSSYPKNCVPIHVLLTKVGLFLTYKPVYTRYLLHFLKNMLITYTRANEASPGNMQFCALSRMPQQFLGNPGPLNLFTSVLCTKYCMVSVLAYVSLQASKLLVVMPAEVLP